MKSMGSVVAIGGLVGLSGFLGQKLAGLPPIVIGALMGVVLLSVWISGQMK